MNKTIAAKILFNKDVEFTSMDVEFNKFLIYYRKNGELQKYELPLNLIDEFIHVDQNNLNKCPICNSTNIITEVEQVEPINNIKIDKEDIVYFDNISDKKINVDQIIDDIVEDIDDPSLVEDWECLNCGSNKGSLELEVPEIRVPDKPNGDRLDLYDDTIGDGNLFHLQIDGKRYKEVLHWFRIPFRLSRLSKHNNDIFNKIMPLFKYYEKDGYLYLEYMWYLDGIQHKIAESTHLIDDCRVCDLRYLRPPKDFNRSMLKYKYPKIWNLVDGEYEWSVDDNHINFQIKWDIEKYYKVKDAEL